MNIKTATKPELIEIRKALLDRHKALLQSKRWIEKTKLGLIRNWILHPNDGTISLVRAESQVACSALELFNYLVINIDQTCQEWNDVMIYSKQIQDFGDGFELSRIISEGNWVADREDVFLRCNWTLEDGTLLELSTGFGEDIEPVYTEISTYTQRSLMHFASKEIQPISENACLYKTIWHYDPAGWLSRLIPRKMLGNIILKNLVHEHEKLNTIFSV
ncbi:MAG: hypothetical protein Sapg2KO_02100 [Saprospiraceae bacterium]